ncbi:MAG: hypothetical protein ACRCXZ_10880 [Patescibacteria group bacterium]
MIGNRNTNRSSNFETTKNSLVQNFELLKTKFDFVSITNSEELIIDLKKSPSISSKAFGRISESNTSYSSKMNLFIHYNASMNWVVVFDSSRGFVKIIDQAKKERYSWLEKQLREAGRQRDRKNQVTDKVEYTIENQSEEYLRKHLKGRTIFRYGVKKSHKELAERNEDYSSQVITILDTGLVEEVPSNLISDKYYNDANLRTSNKFVCHEVLHTFAIPIIDYLFKNLAKFTNTRDQYKGIFNQTYSRFYEIFVESLLFDLFNARNSVDSAIFVYSTPFGKALSGYLVSQLSEEDIEAIKDSIKSEARYIKAEFAKVKEANAEAIEAEFKEAKDKKNLPKKAILTASRIINHIQKKEPKQRLTKDETVSNEFEIRFDHSQYPSLVQSLLNFDMNEFTEHLYRTTFDLYIKAKKWQDSGMVLEDAPKEFGSVEGDNGKPIAVSGMVVESFKYWLSSLPELDRQKAKLSIAHSFKSDFEELINKGDSSGSESLVVFLNSLFEVKEDFTVENVKEILNSETKLRTPIKNLIDDDYDPKDDEGTSKWLDYLF